MTAGAAVAVALTACDLGGTDGSQDAGDGYAIEAGEPFFPVDAAGNEILPCGGYGFRPEDGDLHRAFNGQLNEFRADGTTKEIITSYGGFSEADVDKANSLTVLDIALNANTIADDGGLLDELRSTGTIQIGIANERPFGYVGDDGAPTGIGPDVASAVLDELGIENVEASVVAFDQLIDGLESGEFDLIAAGMYITSHRAERILFSDPTFCTAEGLAVVAGNPDGIVDYGSFVDDPDLTLGAMSDSAQVGYAEEAGIPAEQVRLFDDTDAMYDALETGEVDAVSGPAATIASQVQSRS